MLDNGEMRHPGRVIVFGDSYSAGAVDLRGNTDGPTLQIEKH
ncbi:hypothetical protein GA0061078_0759 [Bifidobacterium bohemicum]|uniref:Uncharacterized protein n=1 Tax=Bifidobacterium bohemicum DSM 22767 TaxID=1437606 RepID=A0A086ZKE9_9BIFI|nr:hypothetical protein [Bifidobacterium bohemicum]KFI46999.1 hypothetical protein BBOH_0474 [Bifidobacterium bohemicum DSM 22767]SCB87321.1 hypothetical protein GA0061078_0759 [Bifidobacterium bohemicum]